MSPSTQMIRIVTLNPETQLDLPRALSLRDSKSAHRNESNPIFLPISLTFSPPHEFYPSTRFNLHLAVIVCHDSLTEFGTTMHA